RFMVTPRVLRCGADDDAIACSRSLRDYFAVLDLRGGSGRARTIVLVSKINSGRCRVGSTTPRSDSRLRAVVASAQTQPRVPQRKAAVVAVTICQQEHQHGRVSARRSITLAQ